MAVEQNGLSILCAISPCQTPACAKARARHGLMAGGSTAHWLRMAKTRQKICSLVISRIFPASFSKYKWFSFLIFALFHIEKKCQTCCMYDYDQTISRIFEFYFWRDFVMWHNSAVYCCCCGSMVCRRIAEYPYSQHSSTTASPPSFTH